MFLRIQRLVVKVSCVARKVGWEYAALGKITVAENVSKVQAQIEKQLGFFPPIFRTTLHFPTALESLWRQAKASYYDSSIPSAFKEQLLQRLAEIYHIPYATVAHSPAAMVPGATDAVFIDCLPQSQEVLSRRPTIEEWPVSGSELGAALLDCVFAIFRRVPGYRFLQTSLVTKLGVAKYVELTELIGYLQLCEFWMVSHPELFHVTDSAHERLDSFSIVPPLMPSGWMALGADETEAEEKLLSALDLERIKQLFDSHLLDQIDDIVYSVDKDGIITSLNAAFERLMGWPVAEVIGKSFQPFVAPEDTDLANKLFEDSISGEAIRDREFRSLTRDGRYLTMSITSVMQPDGGIIGVARDISQRKRREQESAEKLQRQSQDELRRFKFICDNANDGFFLFDRSENLLYVNKIACEKLGYTEEEILKLRLGDIDPTYQFRGSFQNLIRALSKHRIAPFESVHRRKDGTLFPVEVSAIAAEFEGQMFMYGVVRDISERKRAELELKKKGEGLARSNSELEQFAYVASHDLKEPLRMVSSYLQLLSRKHSQSLDAEANEFVAFAVEGANRMYALIDDLLTYSRVGTREETLGEIDLESVFALVTTNLEVLIRETGAEIVHTPLPVVFADTLQMTQLFQNLIGNALKFKSDRKLRITIDAQSRKDDWLFTVSDNGIGISPEYAERIFVLFQRLHTKEKYPGTGIGLAICKKIVERHGGRIWVESREGKGSTFYFTIPKRPAGTAA